MKLTQQQLDFIMFLAKLQTDNVHKMHKQIAAHFGVTQQSVAKRLDYLRKKGILNPRISINFDAFKQLENDKKL